MPDLGVSGPTRRYTLIVTMLMGLAAVPTAIVLGAGRAAMDESDGLPGTTPLLGNGPGAPVAVIPDLGLPAVSPTLRHRPRLVPDPWSPPAPTAPAVTGRDDDVTAGAGGQSTPDTGHTSTGGGQGSCGGAQPGGSNPQTHHGHRHHGNVKRHHHRHHNPQHHGHRHRHQHRG